MNDLTLLEWSALAGIALIIVTAAGIIGSLYMAGRALREVHTDRLLRQRPHPAFEGGGWRIPVEFIRAHKRIPGVNSDCVERVFADLPNDAESICIRNRKKQNGSIEFVTFGNLKNFGPGPALETHVVWIPHRIKMGADTFEIDSRKRSEPRYSRGLNSMPTEPQHILPGGKARLGRLPTFIYMDIEKKISEVEGIFEIECEDVFGQKHKVHQQFYMETGYRVSPPFVHVTFLEVLR
ncbi:MAG TPA: hypothetical protein VMW16_01115 [Sedimentisphaerales bacterium]|nr:hypothetical protein [Sedimentisphaerales bacterium]